jgi:MFS family permease
VAEENRSVSLIRSRRVVVAALGTSQTLAWASSYYLPAILADPISAAIGIPRSWFFAAFSASLLITAFAGPAVGRIIDRYGGRGILVLSNLTLASGLIGLAAAKGVYSLFAAWAVLGAGMALGLYDAGFATLAALYGREARGPITGITLFAGFASTVSWPLSTFLNASLGWRETCLVWAALNLVIGLPLNRWFLPIPVKRTEFMPAAAVFAVLYGAGNGLLTIARGTVPLAIFGPHSYGERTGLLGAPARAAQALAPLLFGLLLDAMGTWVIFVSAGLCISALCALLCLRASSTN